MPPKDPAIRAAFGLMGVTDQTFIHVNDTSGGEDVTNGALADARARIQELASLSANRVPTRRNSRHRLQEAVMTLLCACAALLTTLLVGVAVWRRRGPARAALAALSTLLILGTLFALLGMFLVAGMD